MFSRRIPILANEIVSIAVSRQSHAGRRGEFLIGLTLQLRIESVDNGDGKNDRGGNGGEKGFHDTLPSELNDHVQFGFAGSLPVVPRCVCPGCI